MCHMSTWLSWNCSPWNPLSWMTLLVEQSNPDGRCEAAALLSAGCHGRLWGQTAAETSARPGSYLHSSVSCPSSQLLTLLPTCGLRPTPGGLTASHQGRSQARVRFFSTRLPNSPQPLGTPAPTPDFSEGLCGDFPDFPPSSPSSVDVLEVRAQIGRASCRERV